MELYQLGIFKGKNNELLKKLRPIDDDVMERIVDKVSVSVLFIPRTTKNAWNGLYAISRVFEPTFTTSI